MIRTVVSALIRHFTPSWNSSEVLHEFQVLSTTLLKFWSQERKRFIRAQQKILSHRTERRAFLKKALAFAFVITALVVTGQIVNSHNPVPPKPVMKQAPVPICPPYCDKGSKLVDSGKQPG